jgi:hypothetical protein
MEGNIMYTVKSESAEGTYYLINHWSKYKTFFKNRLPQLTNQYFKSEADAKRSLTKLLNGIMGDDYRDDKFTIIEVSESEMIQGKLLQTV